jgi:hypothetical protein
MVCFIKDLEFGYVTDRTNLPWSPMKLETLDTPDLIRGTVIETVSLPRLSLIRDNLSARVIEIQLNRRGLYPVKYRYVCLKVSQSSTNGSKILHPFSCSDFRIWREKTIQPQSVHLYHSKILLFSFHFLQKHFYRLHACLPFQP